MKTLWYWLLRGCLLLGVSVLIVTMTGAGQTLSPLVKDATRSGEEKSTGPDEDVWFAHGTADVDLGLRSLYPAQPGRVDKLQVREGSEVDRGAELLTIDKKPYELVLNRAKAGLEIAKARRDEALKLQAKHRHQMNMQSKAVEAARERVKAADFDLKRLQQDHDNRTQGNKSGFDLEAARALVRAAQAGVEVEAIKLQTLAEDDPSIAVRLAEAGIAEAQAQVDQAEHAVKECVLVAPGPGTVVRVFTGEGEVLGSQPRQPAILFCPNVARIIRAEVDQEFAGRVRKDQEVVIEDDNRKGDKWKGRVSRIPDYYLHRRSNVPEPFAFNETRFLECIIAVEAEKGKEPRLGQRVRVHFKK